MGQYFLGQIAGLATAVCWTVTAIVFEHAGRRVGSLVVNWIRLAIALIGFALLSLVRYGSLLPYGATTEMWIALMASGVAGLALGDLFLFEAFVMIGSRLSMLVYTSVPILTALLGWIFLGETMRPVEFAGMLLIISGIVLAVVFRTPPHGADRPNISLKTLLMGVLLALLGALGQAGGLVISKHAAPDFDAFSATYIRVIAGLAGFSIIIPVMRRIKRLFAAFSDSSAMRSIIIGAFFGPFLGISLGLFAAQATTAALSATLMALVPVFIIPPSVIIYKEKLGLMEIIGTVLAVAGTVVVFL
ncbi:DMT family transporter [Spirochaetia bacterium 38H-sp]|uniref:DMT family transporter n=1 Tax=Rarispira pelagica TaxID=3141764 RepID=A0ABU9UDN1_9SPIR